MQTATTRELETNTGAIVDIVRQVADTLSLVGESLDAGQVIIAGSVVAPISVAPGHRKLLFELAPLGGVSIAFRHA